MIIVIGHKNIFSTYIMLSELFVFLWTRVVIKKEIAYK